MTTDPSQVRNANPRDLVIAAGRQRLLTHGIDGLRSQLNASVLSQEAPVSRDTAYRVFRGDESAERITDAIVSAVAEAANDTAWSGFEGALGDALQEYQNNINREADPATTLIAVLQANFEAQFTAPGEPVGWMLQAAALTASPAWKGDPPPEDAVDLARHILDTRRAFYQQLTDRMVPFLMVAMSDHGRRPRRGVDPRSIVVLIHSLLDGAVLRTFIEPDAISPALVAEAMYQIGFALTEEGPAVDPRRPEDDRNLHLFDRLLRAASDLWSDKATITVDQVAAKASVPPEAASLLFPTLGDLADSLLRSHVVGAGFTDTELRADPATARQELPGVLAQLQRLRDLADGHPYAVTASQAHPPTKSRSFAADFVDNHTRLVEALDIAADPEQLVTDLLTFASQGSAGWPSVVALMRTIGYDAIRP